ncbi:putative membrane protein [plant metagenome]|uniref:Putative membrane protein n=1 Tax=plant metagenome TaxID=1297885 RepID=A0A484NWA8_9ZZZZ
MPILGLGVHVLIALFFAVHAVRSGQQTYWLFILFSFPLLGSLVYFLTIYLPSSRLERGARRAVAAAGRALDPTRDLREAQSAYDYAPTAQNQMQLAAALLEAGDAQAAAQHYEDCLKGPFATDMEIRLGAARAFLACGRSAQAVAHAEAIRQAQPDFRAETVSLLLARAYAADGQEARAQAEYEATHARFGTFESLAEYAIWAAEAGRADLAERLYAEARQTITRWSRPVRTQNQALIRRLEAAQRGAAA